MVNTDNGPPKIPVNADNSPLNLQVITGNDPSKTPGSEINRPRFVKKSKLLKILYRIIHTWGVTAQICTWSFQVITGWQPGDAWRNAGKFDQKRWQKLPVWPLRLYAHPPRTFWYELSTYGMNITSVTMNLINFYCKIHVPCILGPSTSQLYIRKKHVINRSSFLYVSDKKTPFSYFTGWPQKKIHNTPTTLGWMLCISMFFLHCFPQITNKNVKLEKF